MVQNLSSEVIIKQYLLGELPYNEQDQIEERLLTDPKFFEESLIVEDELVDEYLFGLLSDPEEEKFERHFLSVPQQRQKLELAKTLERYASEATLGGALTSGFDFPSRTPAIYGITVGRLKNIIQFFRRALSYFFSETHTAVKRSGKSVAVQDGVDRTWSRILSEAQANRNILASLIEEDWRGLHLLGQLGLTSTSSEEEIVAELNLPAADIAPTLARLVQCGLIEERHGGFTCTALGVEILEKLEEALGESPINP